MRRFILDTGIAAMHLDRKRGVVFERAAADIARGNRVGIAAPLLAELAFRAEGSPQRERNILRLRQALDAWKLLENKSEAARPLFLLRNHRQLQNVVTVPQWGHLALAALAVASRTWPSDDMGSIRPLSEA